jgi:hypothetical protein
MKKLLLVLLVVTLASFLFVGCIPTTPAEGEGEGEGEAEICPTISIAGSYYDATTGKTYVKGITSGSYTVTVTYAQPTEGVEIRIVGVDYNEFGGITDATGGLMLPFYANADHTVYTAEIDHDLLNFKDCEIFTIVTTDCYGECTCTSTFTVDKNAPQSRMKVTVPACICEDCSLTFASDYVIVGTCADTAGCCGDDCSGFASWSIDLYNQDPYDECCTIPCATPVATCSGSACPISCATGCLFGSDAAASVAVSKYYVIIDLADNVGNSKKYWATIVFDSGCNVTEVKQWTAANKAPTGSLTNACIDWTIGGADILVTDATVDYFFLGEATCSSLYVK